MQHAHKNTDSKPWFKQFWPWFLISLPGAVVIASIFTIGLAIENAPVITQKNLGKFVQPIKAEQSKP
tara:strand:+ start:14934 stop:15134 length:201 start_codon:yes stop_codon:yes gene_type:complete